MRAFLLFFFVLSSTSIAEHISQAPPAPSQLARPPSGHGTMRAGLELGYAQGMGSFLSAEYRYGLHDFLDPLPGYPEHTALELMDVKVRLPFDKPRFWLDELTVARIASLAPMEVYTPELSWEVALGARTERDTLCDHCVAGGIRAGLGATWQPARAVPIEAFVLGDIDVSYSPAYAGWPVIPGVGPHAGLRLRVSPRLIGIIDGTYLYKFTAATPGSYDFGAQWRWSPFRDFALSARVHRYLDAWEWAGGLLVYF